MHEGQSPEPKHHAKARRWFGGQASFTLGRYYRALDQLGGLTRSVHDIMLGGQAVVSNILVRPFHGFAAGSYGGLPVGITDASLPSKGPPTLHCFHMEDGHQLLSSHFPLTAT